MLSVITGTKVIRFWKFFVENIPSITGQQMTAYFPLHPMFVSALLGRDRI